MSGKISHYQILPGLQHFATYYNAYIFSNPHSCIIVTKKHYDLAKQLQNPKEMAEALNKKALAFYILSDADQSLTALGEASSILSLLEMQPARSYPV